MTRSEYLYVIQGIARVLEKGYKVTYRTLGVSVIVNGGKLCVLLDTGVLPEYVHEDWCLHLSMHDFIGSFKVHTEQTLGEFISRNPTVVE